MKKILVVEDNREILEVIEEILDLNGYEVYTAENGAVGFELAKKTIPNLIISDVMMPRLDGYTMLKFLRSNLETALIPFIFLTANTQKSDVLKGTISGADRYLTKPFSSKVLLKSVQELLCKYK